MLWRWALLGIAFVGWLAVLLPWRIRGSGLRPADHQRGMYHALAAWAVTDIAAVLAWGA